MNKMFIANKDKKCTPYINLLVSHSKGRIQTEFSNQVLRRNLDRKETK